MHKRLIALLGVGLLVALPAVALADTIDPATFDTSLEIGETVTIEKTVVVSSGGTTSGVLDVMFLFDTSGSMGTAINAAKAAAGSILSGLAGFGNLATGTGYYSEFGTGADPGVDGVLANLTTVEATGLANINAISTDLGGFGGDTPEEGVLGTFEAATMASWRPGSNRFIIAFGDATFKESGAVTSAVALSALDDNNVTFIGLDFSCMTGCGGIDPVIFADATGGQIFAASTTPESIVTAILESVTTSFSNYTEVTVSDLGAGLPGIGMSVECVTADGADCSGGSTAMGEWTRELDREFVFSVTFEALEDGTWDFSTLALVDGGTVATELDHIVVGDGVGPEPPPTGVPEPMTVSLLGMGLAGLFLARRRQSPV